MPEDARSIFETTVHNGDGKFCLFRSTRYTRIRAPLNTFMLVATCPCVVVLFDFYSRGQVRRSLSFNLFILYYYTHIHTIWWFPYLGWNGDCGSYMFLDEKRVLKDLKGNIRDQLEKTNQNMYDKSKNKVCLNFALASPYNV
jgi:hypothetical protein